MEEEFTHLVVNWIDVDNKVILVGATDNLRWKWDTELGMSGADAKSSVWVTLTDNGKGFAGSEDAHFFVRLTILSGLLSCLMYWVCLKLHGPLRMKNWTLTAPAKGFSERSSVEQCKKI